MTKQEERNILKQIEKLIAEAGEDSYIATAFSGCVNIAFQNIENDWACSHEATIATANKNIEQLSARVRELEAELEEIRNDTPTLDELYSKLTSGLKEDHSAWVKSNHKMRSIESAKRQIKTEGDTSCTPAIEILDKEYKKERASNEHQTQRMYARKELIREIEVFANEHGKGWDGTYRIFGY